MLIDLVVVSALFLFGSFLVVWLASPALRARIEQPKHVFLDQARAHDKCQPDVVHHTLDGGKERD